MNLQEVRKTFKEANIITAKNGIAVSYPPRGNKIFRNSEAITQGNTTFLNLLQKSKEFHIAINKNGFLFEFSFDGNPLEKIETLPSYQEPVTWQMLKESRPPRNDIADYRFDKHFSGADTNDQKDLMGRLAGFLSEVDTEIEPFNADENKRWEILNRNFRSFHRYFPELDYDDDMQVLDVIAGSEDSEHIRMIGLPLTLFTEMVKASTEIDFDYSCSETGGAYSFMFVV